MRSLPLLILLMAFALPTGVGASQHAGAIETVDVAQLHQRLERGRLSDSALAAMLQKLQLTQRLTHTERRGLESQAAGSKSRDAFLVLADRAEMLDLPPGEIPADEAPAAEEQTAILARAVGFAANTVTILPRFYATRTTVRFEQVKPQRIVREAPPVSAFIDLEDNSLHVSQPKPVPE